jgi:acyl carrier protein
MENAVDARIATVRQIVARVGKLALPDPDADIFAAGFQSIDALELLVELESEFGVTIPDDDYVRCRTVRSLSALVNRLAGEPQA